MSDPPDFDLKLGYFQSIRRALVCLVLGASLMAGAKLLRSDIPEVRFLAQIAEILGWCSLAASGVVLFVEWRRGIGFDSSLDWYERLSLGRRGLRFRRSVRYLGARHSAPRSFPRTNAKRTEAIDKLYSELRPLLSRAATDPGLEMEVQKKLSRLRQLQSEEAEEMERRFEEGLLLKSGEGWRALERAKELLAQHENPSVPDVSSESKN